MDQRIAQEEAMSDTQKADELRRTAASKEQLRALSRGITDRLKQLSKDEAGRLIAGRKYARASTHLIDRLLLDDPELVAHNVVVNRYLSPNDVIQSAAKCRNLADPEALLAMPQLEDTAIRVYFFRLQRCVKSMSELLGECQTRLLRPDPRAVAEVVGRVRGFIDDYPCLCAWQGPGGVYSLVFRRLDGHRTAQSIPEGQTCPPGWWIGGVQR